MRFLAWIFVNIIYRVRPTGITNVPEDGPAVVVCNHVSYMDPIVLSASIKRPMRFVMYYKIFRLPLLRFLFQQAKAIPIASARENETIMREAFDKVDEELANGNVVCIFPEGGTGKSSASVRGSRKYSSGDRCRSYRWRFVISGAAGSADRKAAGSGKSRDACSPGSPSSSA